MAHLGSMLTEKNKKNSIMKSTTKEENKAERSATLKDQKRE